MEENPGSRNSRDTLDLGFIVTYFTSAAIWFRFSAPFRSRCPVKTIIAVVICFSTLNFAQDLSNAAFRNPALPVEQRVNDLVSRLTLEEKVGQMVHTAPAIPRLGIPQYNWWSEGLHGAAREGYATVFPQAIGLAATFDPDLLHREADVVATEFRAKYAERVQKLGYSDWFHGLTVWSP